MAFLEQHLSLEHGMRFLRSGDLEQAEAIARQLLKRNKRDADAMQLRGEIALKRREYGEALKHFQKCVQLAPRQGHYHMQAGRVLALMGRHRDALSKLDKALQLQPDSAPAAEWKAMVLQWDGEGDDAAAVLAPFIDAGNETHAMAEVMARVLSRRKDFDDAVALTGRHLQRDDLPADARFRLGHVAGGAHEKAGRHDEAFAAHTSANRAVAIEFDRVAYSALIDQLIEVFSADFIADRGRHGNRSEVPVFIAGMPRSGTTLVEQIIDAHPLAFGAGELRDVETIVDGMQLELGSSLAWPRCATDLDAADIARLAKRYLDAVQRLSRGAKRIVNKSLENYRNVGLLAVLFPQTRIIHCHRDPRDTCISCYTSGILPDLHPYISDLGDLGFAYGEYRRLMAHWQQAAPSILDVEYETLVDDLDGQTRRIIDFCGLDWDDACLAFHASGRVVRTASYEQVRQPIYTSSIGRWKGYEKHLGPLLGELGVTR